MALLYSEVYLRLEPLGLECVGGASSAPGTTCGCWTCRSSTTAISSNEVRGFRPDAVGFSLNYLANVPEAIDLAKLAKTILPKAFVFFGGHSVSFIAEEVLRHGDGAIDAIVLGEGEVTAPRMLAAVPNVDGLPGVTTLNGARPARDLQADINASPAGARADPQAPQVFHRRAGPVRVDRVLPRLPVGLLVLLGLDVLRPQLPPGRPRPFRRGDGVDPRAQRLHRRRRRVHLPRARDGDRRRDGAPARSASSYYLETRCDVLIRNKEVFARWAKMGLCYMFLGAGVAGRGAAQDVPQAHHAEPELRGAGDRAEAEDRRGDQPDHRPGWGREEFERGASGRPRCPRSCT